jgi:hypothetical protein
MKWNETFSAELLNKNEFWMHYGAVWKAIASESKEQKDDGEWAAA